MIYTSRYSNPELKTGNYTVVGITRGAPKFPLRYTLAGNIMEIAPPGYLFNEYNRERFTPPYFQHMDRVGTARIAQILQHYEDMGKPVVLCCYEDGRCRTGADSLWSGVPDAAAVGRDLDSFCG